MVRKKEKDFAQRITHKNMTSSLGKIFEIDFNSKNSNIISIGHDNPQGIFYDSINDTIFSTEHGPKGGDELNINSHPSIKKSKIMDILFLLMENIMDIQTQE